MLARSREGYGGAWRSRVEPCHKREVDVFVSFRAFSCHSCLLLLGLAWRTRLQPRAHEKSKNARKRTNTAVGAVNREMNCHELLTLDDRSRNCTRYCAPWSANLSKLNSSIRLWAASLPSTTASAMGSRKESTV